MKNYVYWLKDDSCKDAHKDGYVGVTKNIQQRFKAHKRLKNLSDNVTIEVLFEGSRKECFEYEKELRPEPGMGWNRAKGGSHGWKYGFTHSEETKRKLKEAWTEERHKEHAERMSVIAKGLKGQKRPKQSKAMIGKNNPMFGTKRPDNVKEALSAAHKGKTPANKMDFYCIHCRQRSSLGILKKYHGPGKKNCK